MTKHKPIAERLLERSSPVPFSGCRLFTGGGVPKGYGVIEWNGRQEYAHRVAWALANGPIPAGAQVLHECDVPACINPSHLRVGSAKENTEDMLRKGRHRVNPRFGPRPSLIKHPSITGEGSKNAKLTTQQVQEIRARCAAGERQKALASEFNVTQGHISRIKRGESWAV